MFMVSAFLASESQSDWTQLPIQTANGTTIKVVEDTAAEITNTLSGENFSFTENNKGEITVEMYGSLQYEYIALQTNQTPTDLVTEYIKRHNLQPANIFCVYTHNTKNAIIIITQRFS